LCVGLFVLTVAVVTAPGVTFFLLFPVAVLGVLFAVIYGAVRLAIRHERSAARQDTVL
jgi:hypothetical protein